VAGTKYLEVVKWSKHQKIDKPSTSRLPPSDEASRALANAREPSATDLGPGTKDQGPRTNDQGGEQGALLISREAVDLADRFLKAIKADTDDPQWQGVPTRAQVWLASGWSEAVIIGTARKIMQTRSAPPSIKYFEKAIANAVATLNEAVPIGTSNRNKANGKDKNVINAADALIERLAEINRPAPRASAVCGGEGATDVRLLQDRRS